MIAAFQTAEAACYKFTSKPCGSKTLSENGYTHTGTTTFSCNVNPGPNPIMTNTSVGEVGLDDFWYIDYGCVYSCTGWDPTGTCSLSLPTRSPSNFDYTTSNPVPHGNLCTNNGG
jgi:hypothetical protein